MDLQTESDSINESMDIISHWKHRFPWIIICVFPVIAEPESSIEMAFLLGNNIAAFSENNLGYRIHVVTGYHQSCAIILFCTVLFDNVIVTLQNGQIPTMRYSWQRRLPLAKIRYYRLTVKNSHLKTLVHSGHGRPSPLYTGEREATWPMDHWLIGFKTSVTIFIIWWQGQLT